MGRETVQKIDLDALIELEHELRFHQISENARAVPKVLLASAASLAVGVSAVHAADIHPSEISKALRTDGRNTLVTDFHGQGNPYDAKYFSGPEFQGGNDPFPPGTLTKVIGDGTNLRSEPNTSSRVVAELQANFQLTVVNSEFIGGYVWYQVTNVIYGNESELWIRGDLIQRLEPTVEPAPEPGDPATIEPQRSGATLEAPIIPGPDGIPTPSFLIPGQVIGPMGTFGYPAIQNVMQLHPDWFQPSASSPEFERTGFDQSTMLEGLLRGCAVIDRLTDSSGRVLSPYQQMFCVVEVQSGNPNGIGSFFLILRNNIADGQMGGNVGVVRNGTVITLNDAEAARDIYTQAPAMTRVQLQFNLSSFGGSDAFSETDRLAMSASIENLRTAIQTGTAIAPLNLTELIQQQAERRGVSVQELTNFMGDTVSGVPVPSGMNIVLS